MKSRTLIYGVAAVLSAIVHTAFCADAPPADPAKADPTAPVPGKALTADDPRNAFASDEDRFDGDHLKLRVNVYGFETLDGPDKGDYKCAPKESKLVVVAQVDDYLLVRVKLAKSALNAKEQEAVRKAAAARGAATTAIQEATKATEQADAALAALKSSSAPNDIAAATGAATNAASAAVRAADISRANAVAAVPAVEQAIKAGDAPPVPKKPGMLATEEAASLAAISDCLSAGMVNDYSTYKIPVATLTQHSYRRTGVMFGALVVPFKFHMGGENKLSASSTIAPYVGFRGPAPFGLTFNPVLSAGLGLVPVTNSETNETETKSAFSVAIGVLLTHSKNEKFNAGVLFGKDFLSKGDRAGDKTVDEVWFSIYAGYKL